MPRILLIAAGPYRPWQGSCHRIRHNLEAIFALGYEADLLTFDAGDLPEMEGVKVFFAPRPFAGNKSAAAGEGGRIARLLMFLKACVLADRERYGLIHGMGACGAVAGRVGRWFRTPFVVELHSDDLPQAEHPGRDGLAHLRRLSERHALARANAVICNDMCVMPYLVGLNLHSRACVIPDMPAVTAEVAEPALNLARVRFRTGPDQKIITCVGSHSRFNGLDIFFNATPLILAAVPGARFVVVGGEPGEIEIMRGRLAAAGVESAVSFPGRMRPDELAALLAVSDVLVSPRRGGGAVPVKVLDYLNAGTPIAAVDTPVNRAILSPANALITRPAPDALAEGVIRLCRNPGVGARLAHEGRATLRRENRCAGAFKEALRGCYGYAFCAR